MNDRPLFDDTIKTDAFPDFGEDSIGSDDDPLPEREDLKEGRGEHKGEPLPRPHGNSNGNILSLSNGSVDPLSALLHVKQFHIYILFPPVLSRTSIYLYF